MQLKKPILLVIGVALSACTTASTYEMSEKVSARLAEFEPTGATDSCMSTSRINQIVALDEKHLLVRVGASRYYLNKVSGRCSGADRSSNRLQYSTSTGQLCRNEIIQVVDNSGGFLVGSCSLGDFERLEKIESE